MTFNTLISAQTTAATSALVDVADGSKISFIAHGLGASDVVDIQIYDGTDWQDLYNDYDKVQLTATNNMVATQAPGVYRVNKGVTTGSVRVTAVES